VLMKNQLNPASGRRKKSARREDREPAGRPTKIDGPSRPDLSVGFILLPDFTLLAFCGFIDALRIAADQEDRSRQVHCHWTILGAQRTPVRSSCGVEITPWQTFNRNAPFDYLVVVGGLLRGHTRMDSRILGFLKDADARGISLVGLCTGSFALARAGLMKGYRSCVHWYHLDEFNQSFPSHRAETDVTYRVDGRRITSAGGQSALEVALYLVERHCGRNIASKARTLLLVNSASGSRQPQPHPETKWFGAIKRTLVQRAILLMDEQPAWRSGFMQEIANRLGVSEKTLVRGFRSTFGLSPSSFFRVLRLARARSDLLNTTKSIGNIALDHGFSDASHFTRLFREYYDTTPAILRHNILLDAAAVTVASPKKNPRRRASPIDEILYSDAFSLAALDWPTQ
jgi:transcriptional regulator GlxA family with amidase domain